MAVEVTVTMTGELSEVLAALNGAQPGKRLPYTREIESDKISVVVSPGTVAPASEAAAIDDEPVEAQDQAPDFTDSPVDQVAQVTQGTQGKPTAKMLSSAREGVRVVLKQLGVEFKPRAGLRSLATALRDEQAKRGMPFSAILTCDTVLADLGEDLTEGYATAAATTEAAPTPTPAPAPEATVATAEVVISEPEFVGKLQDAVRKRMAGLDGDPQQTVTVAISDIRASFCGGKEKAEIKQEDYASILGQLNQYLAGEIKTAGEQV